MHFRMLRHRSHTSRTNYGLSTEIFLNCLHRFIVCRRLCRTIFSDNGINFIGARNELYELGVLLKSKEYNIKDLGYIRNDIIEWRLNPPQASHFGEL